ncbi:MAG: hypothetical protein ACHQ1H_07495 [Nitrososphaerales archaeon]
MSNSQKTISFLSLVNSSLGPVNVNFDAETSSEILAAESFAKIYDLGLKWSETYQASSLVSASERSAFIRELLWEFGRRFSANLVIGNSAYGLENPHHRELRHLTLEVLAASNGLLKLGAEGLRNGRKAIDLAARTGACAYILRTGAANSLIDYAKVSGVRFMVYSLLRLAETKSIAADQLIRIKGTGYFERRGVARDNVAVRIGEFSIFGSCEEIMAQITSLLDRGASKVVLFPVFENQKDLRSQLNLLSNCTE